MPSESEPLTSALATFQSFTGRGGETHLSNAESAIEHLIDVLAELHSHIQSAIALDPDRVREEQFSKDTSASNRIDLVLLEVGRRDIVRFIDYGAEKITISSNSTIESASFYFASLLPSFVIQSIDALAVDANVQLQSARYSGATSSIAEISRILGECERRYYPDIYEALAWARRELPNAELVMPTKIAEGLSAYLLSRAESFAEASILNIKKASGEVASIRQQHTFLGFHREEARLSARWTSGVFAFVLAGVVAPIAVLTFDVRISNVSSWVGVLIKLAIALPLFGVAAYCGRVAAQHREIARHMKLMAVQVDTLESYIETMSEQQKSDMRILLGKRLFSNVDLEVKEDGNISIVPIEVVPLLEKAMEIARENAIKRA